MMKDGAMSKGVWSEEGVFIPLLLMHECVDHCLESVLSMR
jgi:hypothetical protein